MIVKLKIALMLIVTVALGAAVIEAWIAQDGAGKTCNYAAGGQFSYLQIEMLKQDPVEPVFSGELLYYLDRDPQTRFLDILTTGRQGYGDSRLIGEISKVGGDNFFAGPVKNAGFIPISGSHRLFPFDSARFDLVLTTKPQVAFGFLRVINRVEGFVLPCSSLSASAMAGGKTRLQFTLRRNPFVQLTALVIVCASIAFGVLILRSKTIEALYGAAASSFFSIWSVRSILSSQIHGFPTVLDLILLNASMGLLLVVFWRIALGGRTSLPDDPSI